MKLTDSFHFKAITAFKFGSLPIGKPRRFVYIYYVDGLLIDTGHYHMRKEILASVHNFKVQQIYLTHHHEDHTANVNLLSKHFNSRVYASKLCTEIMRQPPRINLLQQAIWGKAQPFTSITIKEDFIETEKYRFEIIATPGHAIDMVCLLEKSEGWLFSADLWVASRIKFFMQSESMAQQIQSIQKILQYDFEVLLCSHNPQLKNGRACLQQKLAFLQDFYYRIAHLYAQGLSTKAILTKMDMQENKFMKWLSGGALSSVNMVLSVMRDEDLKLFAPLRYSKRISVAIGF